MIEPEPLLCSYETHHAQVIKKVAGRLWTIFVHLHLRTLESTSGNKARSPFLLPKYIKNCNGKTLQVTQ